MFNQVVLVGRMVRDPELKETSNGKKVCNITLAINRGPKNADGEYNTDFIDIALWENIAERTCEYCKKGDTLGIKGSLSSGLEELDDGKKYNKIKVIPEKISFISSKHKDIEKDDMER